MATRQAMVYRLTYIDGLRGVAIAMVLSYHAWYHNLGLPNPLIYRPRSVAEWALRQGYQGVSLFLVLSGFCLTYPIVARQLEGPPSPFVPSVFFARRILRIIPPYYIAVLLFAVAARLAAHAHAPLLSSLGATPHPRDVLVHLALVQNIVRDVAPINASFWSLALEWQWYLAFPLILLAATRAPKLTLLVCLAAATVWRVDPRNLATLGYLQGRLFEFACGTAAALLIAARRDDVARHAVALTLGALALIEIPPFALPYHGPHAYLIGHVARLPDAAGLTQPLWGVAFACLILAGHRHARLRTLLSWRPLVALGLVSYSVYLVQEPLIQAVEMWTPFGKAPALLACATAVAAALACGVLFYATIERPCLDRRLWQRAVPRVAGVLRWVDVLWSWRGALLRRIVT